MQSPREAGASPRYWHSPGLRNSSDARTLRSRTGRVEGTAASPHARATTAGSTATPGESSWGRLRNKSHAEYPASFQPVFGPCAAVILGDVERFLVHAGVDVSGIGRIEGNTPDVIRRQPGVAELPRLAAVFGENHAQPPAR